MARDRRPPVRHAATGAGRRARADRRDAVRHRGERARRDVPAAQALRSRHVLWYRGSKPRRAIAPVLESLITGEGLHDISLRGFTFADTTWLDPNESTGFPHIYGNMYYAGGPVKPGGEVAGSTIRTMPGSVALRGAQRIAIEGNRFTRLGALGLELSHGIADSLVQGNVVDDIAGGGIWVGAMNHDAIDPGANNHGNRIANNWVHHIGIAYPAIGIGIAQAADSTIAHNQVNATPYSGIVALNVPHDDVTQRVHILDNRVFDTNGLLIDGGAIYLNGRQGSSFETGAVVRGNVVSDANSPVTMDNGFVPIGLYTDDRSDWITLQGNVAYGNYRTFGGVMPRRVSFTGNFWDEDRPGWFPRGSGKTAMFAGNARLPKAGPREACAAVPTCAAILATAGLEPAYRHLLSALRGAEDR